MRASLTIERVELSQGYSQWLATVRTSVESQSTSSSFGSSMSSSYGSSYGSSLNSSLNTIGSSVMSPLYAPDECDPLIMFTFDNVLDVGVFRTRLLTGLSARLDVHTGNGKAYICVDDGSLMFYSYGAHVSMSAMIAVNDDIILALIRFTDDYLAYT